MLFWLTPMNLMVSSIINFGSWDHPNSYVPLLCARYLLLFFFNYCFVCSYFVFWASCVACENIRFLSLFAERGETGVFAGYQLWYPSLKRAERESNNMVSSTVNRYVFCFINARFVGLLCEVSPDRVAFPFQRWLSFQVCSLCPWWAFWVDYNF